MPNVPYVRDHYQKVRYTGENPNFVDTLYVVSLADYPAFYTMQPNQAVVVHLINEAGIIIYNGAPAVRARFTVLKGELTIVER